MDIDTSLYTVVLYNRYFVFRREVLTKECKNNALISCNKIQTVGRCQKITIIVFTSFVSSRLVS